MARWFVIRDGSEHGPLTDSELKSAAAAGKIRPDDSIRREDTTTTRHAKDMKGLTFAPDLNSRLITAEEDFESIDPFDLKQASPETGIAASLEEKEKIQNLLLPRAYAALGKKYFEAVDHSPSGQSPPPQVAPFVEQIVALLLNAPTPPGPGTQSATDSARQKAVEHQLAKKYAQLGKRAYEVGGLSPAFLKEHNAIQDLTQRDKLLNDRISALRIEAKKKREAEDLAAQVRKAKETTGAVVGTVADAGASLIYSTPVVVLLTTLIPPLGLWLIWQHPTWGIKSKMQWAGLSLACFLSLIMVNQLRTAFQNATEATLNAKQWAMEQANAVAGVKDAATEPDRGPQVRPQAPPPSAVVPPAPTPPAAPIAPPPQAVATTVPPPPAAVTPPAPVAPANGNAWQEGALEFKGHLYKVFPDVMTWIAAKQRCEAMGGRLAVIDTPEKSARLRDAAARSGIPGRQIDGIWLGGTDKDKEGEWVWLNGKSVTYSEWGPGQPNNKDNAEHYIMVFVPKWQWSDQPSTSRQHTTCFACEWEPAAAPPAQPIDLLSSIKPAMHSVRGKWEIHADRLIASPVERIAIIQIPYYPPPEYELTAVIIPYDASVEAYVGLVAGGRQFQVVLDGHMNFSGLNTLDGQLYRKNATAYRGPALELHKPNRVVCTVRAGRVAVTCNGRPIIDYSGDPQRLGLTSEWIMPDKQCLFLGAYEKRFDVVELRIVPLSGPSK